MHYKAQVPPNKFGTSAGELAKDYEYIWKSRVVSLLTISSPSADIRVDPPLRKFQHPAIVEGLRTIYFASTTSLGYKTPCTSMMSLGEGLTPGAVAWV